MSKSKLANFFEDDEASFPQKSLDDQKMNQYAHGTVKKSRREKEKEAQEAKLKEEENLTAKAYDEFLETFEGSAGRSTAGPGFVRSGAAEDTYAPKVRGRGAMNSHAFDMEVENKRSQSPPLQPKPKGKRAMDRFLEEIKKDQAERDRRLNRSSQSQGKSVTSLAAYETQSGSRDRGDPATSNLFMANLPPTVSEPSLGNFCAKYGSVASVKIMWPRTDATIGPGSDMTTARKMKNSGLSGFVSFMKRKDAETALREMDGFEWGGNILRVGWSKAVPVGPKAMYSAQRNRSGSPDLRSRSRSPSVQRRENTDSRDRLRSRSQSTSREPTTSRRSRSRPSRSSQKAKLDAGTETFIRSVASLVHEHGASFESNLKEREASNPHFSFLFDHDSAGEHLYNSLVASKAAPEAAFWDDGYNSVYSSDSAEDSERERGPRDRLGRLAKRRFEAMLRALAGRRGEIARCMAFGLEHAEAASEVADIIISSMLIDTTAVPRKVARLHLICDILHNSAAAVPNAWKFRQEFQSRLGLVFDHLSLIYQSFPGRITAETFKTQITAVVDVWEDSIVFPPDFTSELRLRLDGVQESQKEELPEEEKVEESPEVTFSARFKAISSKPAAKSDGDNESVEMEVEDEDSQALPQDDLDGELMDDLDGEPMMDDVDGDPIDDVDGDPL